LLGFYKIKTLLSEGYVANARLGGAWATRLAAAWWLAEVALWFLWPGLPLESPRDELFSALSAACLVTCAWFFMYPIAALLLVGLAGRLPFSTWITAVVARARDSTFAGITTARDAARLAVAVAIWLFVSAYTGWRLCLYFIANIATADVIAAASSVTIVAIAVASALLAPLWLRLGRIISLVLPTRWSVRRGIISLLAALAVIAAATVAVFFDKLVYLPWRQITTLGLIGVLFALSFVIKIKAPLTRLWAKRVLLFTALALVASGTFVALRLESYDSQVRVRIAQNSAFLPVTYRFMKATTDFDSDGFLGWWGENDCAAWNGRIHPLAYDPQDDGIDQDCDGADGSLAGADPGLGRADFIVPDAPTACPIFLITLDAVSAKELSIYGGSAMPLLSRRATQGIVFEWAFSQGPSTRLSVPSMLTSKYDTQIITPVIRGQPAEIDSENVLLAEVLSRAKYYTAAVAPVEYLATRLRGIYQGFKVVDRSPVIGEYRPSQHTADLVTEAARKLIDKNLSKNRFFLWVHYFDPHEPFMVEPGDTPATRTEYGVYQYELSYLDRYLNQLLAFIEAQYSGKPHVVIVSADHGEAFDRSHRVLHHGYDLSTAVTRVPLIVWGIGQPRREKQLVGLIDLMPTLVNIAGARSHRPEGNSLLPLLSGQRVPARPLFGQFYLGERRIEGREPLHAVSVRLHPYVLHYSLVTQGYSLFNYEKDPSEQKDLSKQEPGVFNKLRVTITSWLRRVYPELYHF
jgi:arylsulfatase A-like enzyme